MRSQIRPALVIFFAMMLVTGVVYPLLVTTVAQAALHDKANGSLVVRGGKVIGSALIGQPFDDPGYFWGRPSATDPAPYNAGASSGSNLGPSSEALRDAVRTRVAALRRADPGHAGPIPVDLVTASGSGLDPDITPAAALYQMPRVARARGMDPERLVRLVTEHTEPRQLGVLGEPRVNVWMLNLSLSAMR